MLSSRILLLPLAIHLALLPVNQEEDQLRTSVGPIQTFLKIKRILMMKMRISITENLRYSLLSYHQGDMKNVGSASS